MTLGVPAPLLALGRVLSRIWPRFSLETGMDLSGLARDPGIAERVLGDPLFHRRGTARLSTEVTATITGLQAEAARYPVPVLVLHGGADRMVPPDGSRQFIAGVGIPTSGSSNIPAPTMRCLPTSVGSGCSRISVNGSTPDVTTRPGSR